MTTLRPYQSQDLANIYQAFEQGHRRVLHVLPTGGGKTVEFAEIAKLAAAAGTSTAILVHRDALLLQASRKLYEWGVPHGVIAPGRRATNDLVQVASKDTLVRRLGRYHFELLIIDEAHHAVAQSYKTIGQAYPEAHELGVTATPCRTDGRGLDEAFDAMVQGPTIHDLIQDGYLVEPIPYGPAKRVNLSSLRTRMGDYDQQQLADYMDMPRITGNAVAHYREICPDAPAVVYGVNIKHTEDIAAEFSAAGIRAAFVHGKLPLNDIRRRIAGLGDKSVQVLASCDLISEGVDVPALATVISLRPTKSMAIYLQQIGRGLRPVYAPGFDLSTRAGRLAAIAASSKPFCHVLDHAGNCFRFGFADDVREWSLEGRPKGKRSATAEDVAIVQCPKCYRCHKPAPMCPECGHVYVIAAREPLTVNGSLEAIDKEALRAARKEMIRSARTYDDLRKLGRQLGFAPQWALRVFVERGGRMADAR